MGEKYPHDPNNSAFFDILLEDVRKQQALIESLVSEYYGFDKMELEDWYRQPIAEWPFNGQIPAYTILKYPEEVLSYARALTGQIT